MQIECVNAFGNFVKGDVVEVPDDALFDTAYFRRVAIKALPAPPAPKADSEEGK